MNSLQARDENDAFTIHLICKNLIHTAPTYQTPPSTVKTSENDLRRRNNVEQSSTNPQPLPAATVTSPQSKLLNLDLHTMTPIYSEKVHKYYA